MQRIDLFIISNKKYSCCSRFDCTFFDVWDLRKIPQTLLNTLRYVISFPLFLCKS
jgi:hypothetical protein